MRTKVGARIWARFAANMRHLLLDLGKSLPAVQFASSMALLHYYSIHIVDINSHG